MHREKTSLFEKIKFIVGSIFIATIFFGEKGFELSVTLFAIFGFMLLIVRIHRAEEKKSKQKVVTQDVAKKENVKNIKTKDQEHVDEAEKCAHCPNPATRYCWDWGEPICDDCHYASGSCIHHAD